ncbi:MAG: dihydroneopterin aldolase [Cytophagaceae bacterium]|nr:dihydroneopterin aldolase [Cytophagaceae bacterium]MBK9510511.1 dihydroneopterin aldolase [Cytophagaceae bacterium]MBK9934459.1 dihydroneopterin aldolase [Cytophagaceae bacterium]MBL0300904.1 dihydroneopterin aldolase [Cytophagaceae bacterium]MBL0323717.1 dihydroneopterin aldolase [Cytophagaceae bacterium]
MDQIALEGMEFFAYHGHFDEEQKIGNKYSIDLYLDTNLKLPASSDKLKDTIDYGIIYQKVSSVMAQKHRLLEHVAYDIIESLKVEFANVNKIRVVVSKFNPPIGGVCNKAKVTIEESF